jgi:hypothetical protein
MSERSIEDIRVTIEDVFVGCGDYICIDKDNGETWRDAFRRTFPDMLEEDIDILIAITNSHGLENDEGVEIRTEDFATILCERNGCDLIEWCSDQVFDSPGLDIFVLSFIIENGLCIDLTYSFHNAYYRG